MVYASPSRIWTKSSKNDLSVGLRLKTGRLMPAQTVVYETVLEARAQFSMTLIAQHVTKHSCGYLFVANMYCIPRRNVYCECTDMNIRWLNQTERPAITRPQFLRHIQESGTILVLQLDTEARGCHQQTAANGLEQGLFECPQFVETVHLATGRHAVPPGVFAGR